MSSAVVAMSDCIGMPGDAGRKGILDVISATSVMGDHGDGFQGHGVCIDKFAEATVSREVCQDKVVQANISRKVQMPGLYREIIYGLDEEPTIYQPTSNTMINSAPDGADDLFYQVQVEDCGLERLLMKQSVDGPDEIFVSRLPLFLTDSEPSSPFESQNVDIAPFTTSGLQALSRKSYTFQSPFVWCRLHRHRRPCAWPHTIN